MNSVKYFILFLCCCLFCFNAFELFAKDVIVDTAQVECYDDHGVITYPSERSSFYGQDSQYLTCPPSYKDNKDGTVTDLSTGLMWSKGVDKKKVSLVESTMLASKLKLGGYSDWRVPSIKELYSLIDFRGYTGSGGQDKSFVPSDFIPFINTDFFDFKCGDIESGERYIDAQWLSNTKYVSTTMNGAETLFGVNFADGRIKGYGYKQKSRRRREKKFFVRFVRGNYYGHNDFVDNGDGTITDRSTGLMWMKSDSGQGMNWQEALFFAENLHYENYDDWRLPNAKELQHIVDYSRSPDTTGSPAIDPVFESTQIINEAGKKDYPYYWSSTTHLDGPSPGSQAAYVSFGRALGKMNGAVIDVHGAGAQRSDPKTGNATFRGPQGDIIRVKNYIRCVRAGNYSIQSSQPLISHGTYPYNTKGKYSHAAKKHVRSGKEKLRINRKVGFVDRIDSDGDGRVSKSEFDGPRHHFDKLDRNNDGYLSESEAPHRSER